MKQHFWNVTSRAGWWKSLKTWTIALLASGTTCNTTQWVYLCFLTLPSHLSALCHCSLHIGGVEEHLSLFQVCFGMWIQLPKLQQSLLVTSNASHHLYMLNMSSFSFMNMHGAITSDVTLAASLKLHGIMIKKLCKCWKIWFWDKCCKQHTGWVIFWVWFCVWFVHFKIEWGGFSPTNLFYYFLEKQERIKLPSVWVTMGMW